MGEVEFLAKSAPGVGKYDLNKSYSSVEKHIYQYKFAPMNKDRPNTSSIRVAKSKDPGPSDYNVEDSVQRT